MNKIFLFALSATGALATNRMPLLAERQVVAIPCSDQGLKDCGTGCIQTDWTCCPSKAGGCPPTAFCDVGANGEYGCCPNGSTCGGDGGANTRGVTSTIVIPGRTTTILDAVDTEEPQGPIVETQTSLIIEVSATTIDIPISQPTGDNNNSIGPDQSAVPDQSDSSVEVPPVVQTPNPEPTNPNNPNPEPNPEPNPNPNPNTETAAGTPVPMPVPTPVTVNAASSNGYSWMGGVVAGLAALLI